MDKFWKDTEEKRVKCIYCKNKCVPKVRDYENTRRTICSVCGATIEIVFKPKKLKKRDW